MGTFFAWLVKNPLVALCVLLAVGGGVQTWRLNETQTALATEKLAFSNFKAELAQKSLKVVQDAATKSDEQIAKLKTAVEASNAATVTAIGGIRNAKSTGACNTDPVYLSIIGGVSDILGAASGGAKGQTGQRPAGPVR